MSVIFPRQHNNFVLSRENCLYGKKFMESIYLECWGNVSYKYVRKNGTQGKNFCFSLSHNSSTRTKHIIQEEYVPVLLSIVLIN